jgi:hypothetical protein
MTLRITVRVDYMRSFWIAPLLGLALAWASTAHADLSQPCLDHWAKEAPPAPTEGQQWTFTFAPIVYHWVYDEEHKPAFVFALERRVAGDRLCGLSLFRNSFGQPSAYVYVGQRWGHLWGIPQLSVKLTAGVIYGYTGNYHDKVPFNWNGFSPTVVPSLVYQFRPKDSLDVMLLGTAAVILAYSHNF